VRSGELARLAGVTVRALRHYHQVGVLPEPERSHNGYRGYDVRDLIRVLRIRRLADLGISLERMPALLDGPGDAAGVLDELDRELAGQIDRLTRQRSVIARLREHGAAPDLPPELAPSMVALASAGLAPELIELDRDQSVLLAHLVGEEGMPQLARFYERLSDPSLIDAVATFSERFSRLGPTSSEQDVAEVVEGFVAAFGPLLEELGAAAAPFAAQDTVDVLEAFTFGALTERQRAVLAQLEARIHGDPSP
jgi:DNA-binding transcriptional MerR regulator